MSPVQYVLNCETRKGLSCDVILREFCLDVLERQVLEFYYLELHVEGRTLNQQGYIKHGSKLDSPSPRAGRWTLASKALVCLVLRFPTSTATDRPSPEI